MRTSLAMAACAGLLSSACSIDVNGAGAELIEEKTFQVTGQPELTLHTFDGSIEVRSWDRNEVRVEIRRRAASNDEARALEVTTTQDGNRILIDAPAGRDRRRVVRFGGWVNEGVSFRVQVPRQLALDAQTGDGSIAVEELAGRIVLKTGDGSIRGSRVEGEITADTGDGSITITDAAGSVNLDSGDGSVRLSGRIEDLRVHTGDGSVSMDVIEGSAMKSDWSVTTGDGSITLNLPQAFDGEVDVQSGDGSVTVNGASGTSDAGDDRGSFRGRLGAGGRTLTARSGDGSITISSR
jgi:hypothetical protein